MTKKCVNLAWNQYGYQWDSLAIDCLIVITRNRFRMCAFLFFFCWSFYLVWWKRNVSRRHICSPVIPFTIHKTHWHTYGNNNIKRPQISRNEFFMLAVRQQHTARCETHRLDKRIRTSFEHEHTNTRKRSVTMSEKGRKRANGKPYISQCRHWRCCCRSYCCYCVWLLLLLLVDFVRAQNIYTESTQLVGYIVSIGTHKHTHVKTMANRTVWQIQILVCHSSYTPLPHGAQCHVNTHIYARVCESQFQCNDLIWMCIYACVYFSAKESKWEWRVQLLSHAVHFPCGLIWSELYSLILLLKHDVLSRSEKNIFFPFVHTFSDTIRRAKSFLNCIP